MSEPTESIFVVERILHLLETEGIRTLFGIPDPCFVTMFSIAEQRGWRVIAPHHEAAGGFMADGLYRLTGKPGVIIGNEGPGVANLAPAAIAAAKEHIPTLFIAGQRERFYDQQVRRGHFQYTRQPRYFEEAMKFVGILDHAEHVDDLFHEAFRQAFTGTPGPVYIELPQDFSASAHGYGRLRQPAEYRLVHQRVDAESLRAAADLLESAEQPILLLGNGAFASRAHGALEELAQRLYCPVIHTPGAASRVLSVLDRSAPYGSPAANDAISQADVVLAIGTEIGEPIHYGCGRHWTAGRADRKWIYLERDSAAFGVNRAIDVALQGDLRDVVPQLNAELSERRLQPRMPDHFSTLSDALAAEIGAAIEAAPSGLPLHPAKVMAELAQAMPDDPVVVRDGGAFCLWHMGFTPATSSDSLWCQNFGHLGTGLGHAIGAQLAVGSERRVVLIAGDSALQFHISELETAVRKNLPIVVVVGCDYAFGLEAKVYHEAFGEEASYTEARWGKQVRFDRIAEGFGAHGEFVESLEDIGPALQRALACGRPALLQIPIDPVASAIDVPGFEEFITWYGERGYSA